LPARQPEQIADRRLCDQPPHQHGVALVLRPSRKRGAGEEHISTWSLDPRR
jgi:hypothetical protein